MSLRLERDFPQIQHYNKLGPPIKIKPSYIASKHYVKQLNSNLTGVKNMYDFELTINKPKYERFHFISNTTIYIQPTIVAPRPNVILSCLNDRIQATRSNLQQFVVSMQNHVVKHNDSTQTLFYDTFIHDLNIIKNITSKPKYRCLIYDFQFIISVEGHLSHFDLDRCYNQRNSKQRTSSKVARKQCFANIDFILEQVFNTTTK